MSHYVRYTFPPRNGCELGDWFMYTVGDISLALLALLEYIIYRYGRTNLYKPSTAVECLMTPWFIW